MKKLPLQQQLDLGLSELSERILQNMPQEKATELRNSGLMPYIEASLNGLQNNNMLEAVKKLSKRRVKLPDIAIIINDGSGEAKIFLKFPKKMTEEEILTVVKKVGAAPASIMEAVAFAPTNPLPDEINPLIPAALETLNGSKQAGCLTRNKSGGIDATWVTSLPIKAYVMATFKNADVAHGQTALPL